MRQHENLHKAVKKLFNDDQIKLLTSEYKKVPKWSNATLKMGYRVKFVCGTSGNSELRNLGYPFPAPRILTNYLENLHFESGILEEIFKFLKIKISQMPDEIDTSCMLIRRSNELTKWSSIVIIYRVSLEAINDL